VIIAIDPSINHIGCAQIDSTGHHIDSQTIISRGKSSNEKLDSIQSQLKDWIHDKKADVILIEHTRFFARQNNQSHASAQKLNLAKGLIYGTCKQCHAAPIHLVWIPGFNKQQADLLARIYKVPSNISQHEKDAFWLANVWSQTRPAQQEQILSNSQF
jgi:hypothetical protein